MSMVADRPTPAHFRSQSEARWNSGAAPLPLPAARNDIAGTTLVAAGTLDLSGPVKIADLGGDGLVVTFGTLELGANNATAGSLFQNAGAIDGTGTLTITGDATLGDSALEIGTGTTLLDGRTTIGLGGNLQLSLDGGRTLENNGTLNWIADTIYIGVGSDGTGATIKNDANADFNIETDNAVAVQAGATGTFINAGTVTKSGTSGTATINALFQNTGNVVVGTGTLAFGDGGSSDAGAFTAAAGAVLDFDAGTFTVATGTYNLGAGATDVSGATLDFTGADAIANFGDGGLSVTDQFATLNLAGLDTTVSSLTFTGGVIEGTGTLTVTGQTYITAAGFDTDFLGTGKTILDGPTTIAQNGAFRIDQGRTVENAGALLMESSVIYFGRGDVSDGSTFVNDANATFDVTGDSVLFMNKPDNASDSFDNEGTFTVDAGGNLLLENNVNFVNDGTITIGDSGS